MKIILFFIPSKSSLYSNLGVILHESIKFEKEIKNLLGLSGSIFGLSSLLIIMKDLQNFVI